MIRPCVSIIVPIYNVSDYVDACVTSIINQSFPDYEIILVDDGSTDGSGVLCDRWGEKDNRIHVVHKTNGGLSDARNAGLDVAEGKYICFVDGDDTIDSHLLEATIPYLEQGYDLVRFRYRYDGIEKETCFPAIPTEYQFKNQKDVCQFILQYYLTYKVNYEIWSGIYSGEIIREHHLRFVDNKKIFAEDICFFLYYLPHCRSIKLLEEKLYNYQVRSDSILNQHRSVLNAGRVSLLGETVYTYYQSIHMDDLVKSFPAIFFLLIDIQVSMYLHHHKESDIISLRDTLIETVPNKRFFMRQMQQMWRMRTSLRYAYSTRASQWEKINTSYYYIFGNKFIFKLLNKFIYTLYGHS